MIKHLPAVVVLALTMAACGPTPGTSQVSPDSVKHRNDCRLAFQVVTDGQPANRRQWALGLLPTCGTVGGEAVSGVLRRSRGAAVPSPELEAAVMLASVLHDARIFATAREIALDRGAGRVARIQALRVIYFQTGRGFADPYESFLQGEQLTYMPLSDYPYTVGEPLPADVAEQAESVAQQILGTPDLDADLCAAARKVRAAARAMR
jgi:hypothetical protein